MKRLMLCFLIAAITATMASADDMVLHVWQTDGQVLKIKLDQEPTTSYDDGQLVITTLTNTLSFPLENVKRYTYANNASGLDALNATEVTFSGDGETITLTGLKPGTEVALYNVAGQMLHSTVADSSNRVSATVSNLPTGVYVVKAGNITYKITKQ